MTEEGVDRSHALRALTHPVVPFAIAIWLLNDHVLKERFGGVITGKLTDLVALVAFPLLVAAVVSPVTRRPLHVGVGFTIAFFTAINVSTAADRWTEQLMSVLVPSRLTMDPTDLWTLPALLGAVWVWQNAPTDLPHMRRSWGRALLGVGLAACVATSNAGETSERFTGTFMLTAEAPEVSYTASLTLDGKPVEPIAMADYLEPNFQTVAFGQPDDDIVNPRSAVSAIATSEVAGEAVITFTLTDPAFAPMRIHWEHRVFIEGESGGLFFGGSDAEVPVLAVDPPPTDTGPTPLASASFVHASPYSEGVTSNDLVHVYEVVVTPSADADLRLSVPSWFSPKAVVAVIEETTLEPVLGQATPIEAPDRCDIPCTFSIWLSATNQSLQYRDMHPVELYDLGVTGGSSATLVEHQLVSQQVVLSTDPVTVAESGNFTYVLDATAPERTTRVEQITTFLRVATEPQIAPPIARSSTSLGSEPVRYRACCDAVDITMYVGEPSDEQGLSVFPIEASLDVTVELLTLEPMPDNSIEASISVAE